MPEPGDREIGRRLVERFGQGPAPHLVWAPGRVNLIGDHIDYCGGRVLPMPIQFGTTVAARLNPVGRVRGISANSAEAIDIARSDASRLPVGSWGRFLTGAIAVLDDNGIQVPGVDVMVRGTIPGSGLSSSASLSVALLQAFTCLVDERLSPLQLAKAAQRIEHEHIGVQCGLMDQAVIALAEPGYALWFDCLNHTHRSISIDAASIALVVADTGRTRQLVHSTYNERRAEVQQAARALGVDSAALARVDACDLRSLPDDVVRRRARHVVGEAARVDQAVAALESHNWTTLGASLSASHASLRDDYEVSSPELDALATAVSAQSGCYGARMTGAGFGGSVVGLLETTAVASAMALASATYAAQFGHAPAWFKAKSLGGARSFDG
jgi:galactokinase